MRLDGIWSLILTYQYEHFVDLLNSYTEAYFLISELEGWHWVPGSWQSPTGLFSSGLQIQILVHWSDPNVLLGSRSGFFLRVRTESEFVFIYTYIKKIKKQIMATYFKVFWSGSDVSDPNKIPGSGFGTEDEDSICPRLASSTRW